MIVTDGKVSDARVRHLLDPVHKNVLGKLNSYKIVFKDISKVDWQNLIIGSLLSEIEICKLTDESVK